MKFKTYYTIANQELSNNWIIPLVLLCLSILLLLIFTFFKRRNLLKNTIASTSYKLGGYIIPFVGAVALIATIVIFVSNSMSLDRSKVRLNSKSCYQVKGKLQNLRSEMIKNHKVIYFEVDSVNFEIYNYDHSFAGLHDIPDSDFTKLLDKESIVYYIQRYDSKVILKLEYRD